MLSLNFIRLAALAPEGLITVLVYLSLIRIINSIRAAATMPAADSMISTAEPGRDGAATAPMVVMYVVELVELEEVLVLVIG